MNSCVNANEDLNLTCPINKQYICTSENCIAIKPSVTIELYMVDNNADYNRCDKKGCDKYPSSITQSGIYTLISPIGKSSVMKIDLKNLSFMETSSLDFSTFIAFGQCHDKKNNLGK
jgi:hypothetical protein